MSFDRRMSQHGHVPEPLRVRRLNSAVPVGILLIYIALLLDYGPHRLGLRLAILVLFLPMLSALLVALIYMPLRRFVVNPRDWKPQLWFGVFAFSLATEFRTGYWTGVTDERLYQVLMFSILVAFIVLVVAEWVVMQMRPGRVRGWSSAPPRDGRAGSH